MCLNKNKTCMYLVNDTYITAIHRNTAKMIQAIYQLPSKISNFTKYVSKLMHCIRTPSAERFSQFSPQKLPRPPQKISSTDDPHFF